MKKEVLSQVINICNSLTKHSFNELVLEFSDVAKSNTQRRIENFGDGSIESRLNLTSAINLNEAVIFKEVLQNIKNPDYKFTRNDIEGLNIFGVKLNYVISAKGKGLTDQLVHFKHGVSNWFKGVDIDLPELINNIRENEDFQSFENSSLTAKNIINSKASARSLLIKFFSACKFCQDSKRYPLYYVRWKASSFYFFNIEKDDYDAFCQHYNELDLPELRHINFGLYYDLLMQKLMIDEDLNSIMKANANDRKQIEKDVLFEYEKPTLTSDIIAKPIRHFDDYRWFWASAQPVLGLNKLDVILGVTKVIGEMGGNATYNDEFKRKLVSLEKDLGLPFKKLSKSELDNSKNVIASAREYWQSPGLLNPDNSLTDYGFSVANNSISERQLAEHIICNLTLPNPNLSNRYTSEIIDKWQSFNLVIQPFKLILKILSEMEKVDDSYITEDELVKIIIPIAADTPNDILKYCNSLLQYRNNDLIIDDWPRYSSGGPEDKRLPKEFLVALNLWGYLEKSYQKGVEIRYFLTNLAKEFLVSLQNVKTTQSVNPMNKSKLKSQIKKPINKIYFGAPGTGKSYKIAHDLKQSNVDKYYQRRVTFHPDYDNAAFLGAYKPISNNGQIDYKFVPQVFTNIFVDACNDPENQYYLIIEEINRGNCAEIFGELFQLLDREDEYSITPSDELIRYLTDSIELDSKYFRDKKMLLPSNVTIYATMNTSDQSLFPMDSAFKRRWDWEYIPINLENSSDNPSSKYYIKLGNEKVSWIRFIEKVNEKISENRNLGMDKCLGNYFVKPDKNGAITVEDFVNKVIFYLWNDVFIDEPIGSIFSGGFLETDKDLTYESFFPIKNKGEEYLKILFQKLGILDSDNEVDKNQSENE